MAAYTTSLLAEVDIDDIVGFTIRRWDAAQADRYLTGLEAFFMRLAEADIQGRPCDEISSGLRSARYVSHVVFFRLTTYGARIVRVLHKSRLPELHTFEPDEE